MRRCTLLQTTGPVVALLALALVGGGCMTVSQTVRPHVVDEGQLRVTHGVGFSRALGLDVEYARPADRDPDEYFIEMQPAFQLDAAAYYGLREGVEVGMRLDVPLSPLPHVGGKLEAAMQLQSSRLWGDDFDVSVGAGVAGFYRPQHEPASATHHTDVRGTYYYEDVAPSGHPVQGEASTSYYIEDGKFTLQYHGLLFDVPVVFGVPLRPWVSLFGAVRYGYLMIDATQSYLPPEDGFETPSYDKEVRQHVFGWVAGAQFEIPPGRRAAFIVSPQLHGMTVDVPDRGVEHQIGGTVELGGRF